MASTVIGLFEERADAAAAGSDLKQAGFSDSDIEMKEAGSASGLDSDLQGHGVPDADIKLFLEGIRAGDTLAIAHTDDDKAEQAREIMDRHGALDIHDAYAQRGTQTAAVMPTSTTASAMDTAAMDTAAMGTTATTDRDTTAITPGANLGGETVIPIVEEELSVGKREIQRGGARIHTRITERPVSEQVTLREEQVTVDRRPVDRAATAGDMAFKEQNFEVTETDEVPVVSKEARVVEEVVVGKTATERTETVSDTVRRTDVDVEDLTTDTRKP